MGPGAGTRSGEAFADPKVAELQRTATDVQRELADLSDRVRAVEDELAPVAWPGVRAPRVPPGCCGCTVLGRGWVRSWR
ncbi:hypothetical protein [Actinokineospora sp. NBRC 105648]|uniref:hypothetical protein n=1 Tax=Actinokineospora sp. NBRC 105648 TaxID=3032206 RepID=UPI0024A57BD9|nr:hypothetical protein [Actinokineospora sp. NBRC 105648]GLZ43131.1 hypothetical protein Acsp05_67550 [Actinokineospora sp. NBRC 105648]